VDKNEEMKDDEEVLKVGKGKRMTYGPLKIRQDIDKMKSKMGKEIGEIVNLRKVQDKQDLENQK
jgi:hypothetical protein